MWKTILIGAALVIGIAVSALIAYFITNPDGFTDIVFSMNGNFRVRIDGKRYQIELNEFRDGVTAADRAWLMKKWVLLNAMARKDTSLQSVCDEFSTALVAAGKDATLDGEEVRSLRAFREDIVSAAMVKHWMKSMRAVGRDPDDD